MIKAGFEILCLLSLAFQDANGNPERASTYYVKHTGPLCGRVKRHRTPLQVLPKKQKNFGRKKQQSCRPGPRNSGEVWEVMDEDKVAEGVPLWHQSLAMLPIATVASKQRNQK